jgi:mannose-1-phosphate guanylyltransferase
MDYAVIMAGGSGTRLWPLSRQKRPKQALKLIGQRTMFQHAVDRITPLFPPERILVVTRDEHATLLMEQVPELPTENFILEPEGRGTAPAIGLAAIHLRDRDPHASMVVLTADHYISEAEEFRRALSAALQVAQTGQLITLGIKPTAPSTGFGYAHHGASLGTIDEFPTFHVERFVEKPDLKTATEMIECGEYSWNSGMFIWRVDRILAEFEQQMPGFNAQLSEVAATLGTPAYTATMNYVWPRVAKQTIDYGIMEQAKDVAIIPVSIGWTDVGSWGSLLTLLPADSDGNIIVGPHVGLNTRDTLAFSDKRLIATIGVQGLVIVDTDDAVLVCPKDQEQAVRELVDTLKRKGYSRLL